MIGQKSSGRVGKGYPTGRKICTQDSTPFHLFWYLALVILPLSPASSIVLLFTRSSLLAHKHTLISPPKRNNSSKAHSCPHFPFQLYHHYSLYRRNCLYPLSKISFFLLSFEHVSVRLSLPPWNKRCSCHHQ